jgi:glutathione synthase/RimK-type ligase-like ATP-grasp enzyme
MPSLFQKYIKKKYEIRSFFLGGNFFSMAVMSQSDQKTMIDFRNYNYEKPNRYVPYKLPKVLEKKLQSLMYELNLKTGSIDLIFTEEGKYIFLEVNPIGQFGMTSYPCNYYLESEIAKYLIKNDN